MANPQDALMVDMAQAFKSGDSKTLAQLLPRTKGHALESWAVYWEAKRRLDSAQASEVQAAMASIAGTYAEDRLRNDWLLLLGQRRDWAAFSAELPKFRMRDDREVQCYAALVEHVAKGADTSELVKRNWYGIRDADDGCALAAARLFDAKLIKEPEVWLEARLSAEGNRGRAVAKAVEIAAPEAAARAADAFAKPAAWLAKAGQPASRASKEIAVLAVIRLAATDVDAAAAALDKIDEALSAEQRSYAWGVVGKQANLRLDADALAHFAKAKPEHLSDDLLGWQARAALRVGRWNVVQRSVEAMGPAGKAESTWTYWHAHALMAQHPAGSAPHAQATAALEKIANLRGFYEMLAMERLNKPINAPARPPAPSAEEMAAARNHPGLNRALQLIALGLRAEGVREWNYSTNLERPGGMDDRELLAAAQLACDRGVWDRCINTSERTKEAFDHAQRFPMPFKDQVLERSAAIKLDPAYVYGLIRQESRFITDARSHVGASGLMQVMPATARWTAKKIGLTNFKPGDINDRDTNIAIGTAYLKLVLDDMGGQEPLAAAAYNAGPGRPRAWRQGPRMDAAAWAENVPFAETRDYVKKVAANATLYAAVITGKPQSIRARLGEIGPKTTGTDNKDLP